MVGLIISVCDVRIVLRFMNPLGWAFIYPRLSISGTL